MVGVTEAQMSEFKDAFLLFDKDKNGIVSSSELLNVFKCVGITLTEVQVNSMLKAVDENGSGHVELDDFCAMMTKQAEEVNAADMMKAFNVFDLDGNGFIDPAELKSALKSMGADLTDETIKAMIDKADTDGDGLLNYAEFVKQMYPN